MATMMRYIRFSWKLSSHLISVRSLYWGPNWYSIAGMSTLRKWSWQEEGATKVAWIWFGFAAFPEGSGGCRANPGRDTVARGGIEKVISPGLAGP